MAETRGCDVAIWDVRGDLAGGVRDRLARRTRHDGPQIVVEAGLWLGRRVAVGLPQRLTASQAGALTGCLQAMMLGNPPRALVVVGPATAVVGRGSAGDVVVASTAVSDEGRIELERPDPIELAEEALIGAGPLRRGSDAAVTTDWAAVAARAAADRGVPTLLVAVVTGVSNADPATPPSSRRRTQSREAGAFFGRLLKGEFGGGEHAEHRRQALKTLKQLVESLRRGSR